MCSHNFCVRNCLSKAVSGASWPAPASLCCELCQSGLLSGLVTQVLCQGEGFALGFSAASTMSGWVLCTISPSVDAPCTLLSWLPCLHFCSHLMFWQFHCVWRPTWEILLSAPVIKKSSLKFDNSILIQLLVFLNTAFLSSLTKEWLQGQFDR